MQNDSSKIILGSTGSKERENILQWFNNIESQRFNKKSCNTDVYHCKFLVNVAVFEEGVDSPLCDCVVFTTDKYAESAIVQNIGRCMRNPDKKQENRVSKKSAFIILPCVAKFLDDKCMGKRFKTISNAIAKHFGTSDA